MEISRTSSTNRRPCYMLQIDLQQYHLIIITRNNFFTFSTSTNLRGHPIRLSIPIITRNKTLLNFFSVCVIKEIVNGKKYLHFCDSIVDSQTTILFGMHDINMCDLVSIGRKDERDQLRG